MWGDRVSRGSAILRGRDTNAAKITRDPLGYMRAHGVRNNSQILHGDQTTLEIILQGQHATCPGQNFVTRIVTNADAGCLR